MAGGERNDDFVRLRKAAAWTHEQLIAEFADAATRLGLGGTVSRRTVIRWESGSPPCPAPMQQTVLEAMFGVPLTEMGFDVPEHRRPRSTGAPAPEADEDPVDRRRFLSSAASVAVAAVLDPADDRYRVDSGDLRLLEAQVEHVYRIDHTQGSGHAGSLARQIAVRVQDMLARNTYLDAVGNSLQTTLGAVVSHLGWLAYDSSRYDTARNYCLEALAAARLTNDNQLEARALASLSLIAIEQSRYWEACSATAAAWTAIGRTAGPTVRSMIATRQAGALGEYGDLKGARRALTVATASLDRAGGDEPPRWAVFFGQAELDQATAAYYLAEGRPDRAVPFLRQTVRGLGAEYRRNAAHYRAKLASALLAAGDIEEACAEAETVVDQVASVDSAKLLAELASIRGALSQINSEAARSCTERLTVVLGSAA